MHVSRVGLHLRLHTTVSAVARTAKALQLPFFQLFLHKEEDAHRLFSLSAEDEKTFLSMRPLFKSLYVHGSYLVNMAINRQVHSVLEQEIVLAKRLQMTHYILHPGALEKGITRSEMLDRVVRVLNTTIAKHQELIFCVENTANPSALLGGMLEDFVYIQERIDIPERFAFCIDTAHAHAAGYDLTTVAARELFFALLIKYTFPIVLVHLNDTCEQLGSHVDCHAKLGTGIIGMDALHAFASHPLIREVPLLVESPEMPFDMMSELLHTIKKW